MLITQLGDKYLHDTNYSSNVVSDENLISINNGTIAIGSEDYPASIIYGTVDNYGITIINPNSALNGRSVILNDNTKTMWSGRPVENNNNGVIYKTNYEDINNVSTVSLTPLTSNPKGTGYSLSVYNDKLLVGALTTSIGSAGFEYYNGSTMTRYKWSVNRSQKFGQSVSLYENVALVSHNRFIYYYDIENGSSTTLTEDTDKRLDGNNFTPTRTSFFGKSISHIGDIVAIGDPGSNEGIVYIHYYNTDSTFTIIPQEEEDITPKKFGSVVFMYENIILIGAPETTVNGINNAGRVYIYNIDGEFLSAVSGNIAANEYYGMSVAIDKDILVVRCSSGAFAYRAESELVGDPYIKPMYDTLYKLPDIDAYYRILESKSIKINAQVQKICQEYINQRAKELNDVLFNNIDDDVYEWENMYFFTKICINYNEESVIFDLLKCNLLNECPSWLQLNIRHEKTKSSCIYENEDVIKVVELKIAEILKIETAVYNNPQILNGLKVKMHKERLNGLLIYKYESESAQLSNLYDTSDCYYKKAVLKNSVEEIFYTNNNTSQIRCIDVV